MHQYKRKYQVDQLYAYTTTQPIKIIQYNSELYQRHYLKYVGKNLYKVSR